MRLLGGLRGAAIALLLLAPSLARAGDGLHPRTPVLFEDPPCMTIVNRSVDPVLHFDYTIPYEDLKPEYDPNDPSTWHEVDDGRTHQFFAFCRDHDPQHPLPNWITWADIDKAAAKDLIDPMLVPDEDVLETNATWKDCWFRITGDDERRLITFEEAAKGVDWDTTGLPVGGHVVEGYTWEPWINIWSFRSGVVKVVDSDDPAASPPALALADNQDYTYAGEALPLSGCYSAVDGATITAYWSFTDIDKLEWIPFLTDEPVDGDLFEVIFDPPLETTGETVMIRVDITDPMDRQATTYANFTVTVIEGGDTTDSDTCGESSFIGNPNCETSSGGASDGSSGGGSSGSAGTTAASGSSGGASSSGGGSATTGGEDDAGTCACRSGSGGAPGWALLALVALRGRRRRTT